ncbi:MAG: oligopeptide:H+ symporter [Rickettsiaceae bacterium]|nr:oligopeptide:H+ symporter [Rickettsiaceae bacterium]
MDKALDLPNRSRIPQFLIILFFVEMWERFSYYGMRALLVIYLTSHLGFEDAKAYAIYSLFAAIGYSGPVLGGFIADKLMGFRNMVLLGGIIITLGHLSLTLTGLTSDLLYIGLALIAVGTGMFKGNVTSLLGECYKEEDPDRIRGFTLFYVSVNLGSFLASILCSYVAHLFGWHYGFGLAGIGMIIGLISFIKFEHLLGDAGICPRPEIMNKKIFGTNIFGLAIIGSLLLAFIVSKMLMDSEFFANVLALTGAVIFCLFTYIIFTSIALERKKLIVLSIFITFLLCFFALEMQLGSMISLFVQRNVVKEVLGFAVPASVAQAINPFSVMIFGSLITRYMNFDKKYVTSIFAFGLLTMAICFFILYIGCLNPDKEGRVGYLYIVIALSFMALGELCTAPLVQEQATLLAPKRIKGLIMGILMLSVAFSNLAGIIISKFMSVPSVNGEVDSFESLAIYKAGFWNIGIFNLGVVIVFLLLSVYVHRAILQFGETKA